MKPRSIVLGGRSMGGRMCSIAVAEGTPAAGLVLISYPLHPPGKPEKLRTEHFPAITVPACSCRATRDAFGTPDELESATTAISGPVTHVWIERGNHSLDRVDDKIVAAVLAWRRALHVTDARLPLRRALGPRVVVAIVGVEHFELDVRGLGIAQHHQRRDQ